MSCCHLLVSPPSHAHTHHHHHPHHPHYHHHHPHHPHPHHQHHHHHLRRWRHHHRGRRRHHLFNTLEHLLKQSKYYWVSIIWNPYNHKPQCQTLALQTFSYSSFLLCLQNDWFQNYAVDGCKANMIMCPPQCWANMEGLLLYFMSRKSHFRVCFQVSDNFWWSGISNRVKTLQFLKIRILSACVHIDFTNIKQTSCLKRPALCK